MGILRRPGRPGRPASAAAAARLAISTLAFGVEHQGGVGQVVDAVAHEAVQVAHAPGRGRGDGHLPVEKVADWWAAASAA